MDTKTLYDWASEANLDFSGEHYDAITVWVEQILQDPEWLDDILLDAITDSFYVGPGEGQEAAKLKLERKERLLSHVGRGCRDLDVLGGRNINDRVHAAYATGFTYNTIQIGEAIILAMKAWVGEYVENRADEWWGDVCSYHADMLEGQYEDYLYEQQKDRQLEERE